MIFQFFSNSSNCYWEINIILIKNTEWFPTGSIFHNIHVGIVRKFCNFSFIIFSSFPCLSDMSLLVVIPLFVKKGLMVAQNLMLVIMPCPLILLKCSFINFLLILMHLFLNFRYFCQFESEESLNTYFLRRFSYKFLFLKICSQKESYFLGQFWFWGVHVY